MPVVLITPKVFGQAHTRGSVPQFSPHVLDPQDIGIPLQDFKIGVIFNNSDHFCGTKVRTNYTDVVEKLSDQLQECLRVTKVLEDNVEDQKVKSFHRQI